MRSGVGWDVTRTGRTVRVDVNGGLESAEDARTAMVSTVEHLLDEDVSVVQFNGSALGPDLPKGLAAAVAALELLTERRGKQLIVGPI